MKRLTVSALALLLIGTLSACQSQEQASAQDMEESKVVVSENRQEDTAEEKVLIAYFTLGKNADLADGVDASSSASIQTWNDEMTGNTGAGGTKCRCQTGTFRSY